MTRAGDPEPIVRAFCDASRYAAVSGRAPVDDLEAVRSAQRSHIRARADSAAYAINDLLIGQPVVNVGYIRDRLGVSQPAAHRAIERLVEAEVLVETTRQARHRIWQSPAVLALLDDFAGGFRRAAS